MSVALSNKHLLNSWSRVIQAGPSHVAPLHLHPIPSSRILFCLLGWQKHRKAQPIAQGLVSPLVMSHPVTCHWPTSKSRRGKCTSAWGRAGRLLPNGAGMDQIESPRFSWWRVLLCQFLSWRVWDDVYRLKTLIHRFQWSYPWNLWIVLNVILFSGLWMPFTVWLSLLVNFQANPFQ